MMGVPFKLSVTRKAAALARARPTLLLRWAEKAARRWWQCDSRTIFAGPLIKYEIDNLAMILVRSGLREGRAPNSGSLISLPLHTKDLLCVFIHPGTSGANIQNKWFCRWIVVFVMCKHETTSYVYSQECAKSSCFDEDLVLYLHIRTFWTTSQEYRHNDGHDMLSCDFSVQTCDNTSAHA